MKKRLALNVVMMALLSLFLAACSGGTPKPPVSKLTDLDKLVTNNMTVDQVNTLLTPALKSTSQVYKASNVAEAADGGWSLASKAGGYAAAETAPFQVMLFTPAKAGDKYFAIFFEGNAVIGKSWFDANGGLNIETLLKGTMTSQ